MTAHRAKRTLSSKGGARRRLVESAILGVDDIDCRLIFLSHASMRASAARSLDRRKVVGAKSLGQFASGKIVKFVMTFQETPCRRTDPGNPYCRERQSSVDDKERRVSLMRHEHKREAREQ